MSDTKDQIINSMCLTWRHDFGLEKCHSAFGYSGMTSDERVALRRRMSQLFEHHVAPLIAENERLREEHDKSWRRNQMLEENMRAAEQYVVRYTWFRKQVEHSCPNLFAVYQNIGHDWIQVTDLDRAIDDAIEKEEP